MVPTKERLSSSLGSLCHAQLDLPFLSVSGFFLLFRGVTQGPVQPPWQRSVLHAVWSPSLELLALFLPFEIVVHFSSLPQETLGIDGEWVGWGIPRSAPYDPLRF